MRAARPFKGRRLAHGASYEDLLCQKSEHLAYVVPNQVQFYIKFLFLQNIHSTESLSFSFADGYSLISSDVVNAYPCIIY